MTSEKAYREADRKPRETDLITVDVLQTMKMTSLSRSSLLKLIYAGDVESVKLGRRQLIFVESLRNYLYSLRDTKAPKKR